MKEDASPSPGITLRSISAILLGLVLVAILTQFVGVTAGRGGWMIGTEALPQPVLAVLVAMGAVGGLLVVFARLRLLSRSEMICVAYALLLAAPLMTTGFWRTFLSSAATIGKFGEWAKYDLVSEKMLAYGPDRIAPLWGADGAEAVGNVRWEEREVRPGDVRQVAVLENEASGESSAIRFTVPVRGESGDLSLPLGEHYLFLILTRAEALGPGASYAVRLYYDGATEPSNRVIASRQPARKTTVQPEGFVRNGAYGIVLPAEIEEQVVVEFALDGAGRVEVADVIMRDAVAVERAFSGKRLISAEEYDQLPPEERVGLVVRPDNLFSPAGLAYLFRGFTDWTAWSDPILFWAGFYLITLVGSFALACIFRRQWMQNERFPLPLTKPVLAFSGAYEVEAGQPSLWRNPITWIGFSIVFFYSLLKVLNAYDPGIPALDVNFTLKSYFNDPASVKAFGVNFSLSMLIFSIGLLMELNVVMSLVLGFFLYRLQFWFGEKEGYTSNNQWPFAPLQILGGVLVYGGLILFTTRRYLGAFAKKVLSGENPDGEALSPRVAFLTLVGAFVAMALWALWAGLPIPTMLVLLGGLLLFALVAARFRTECGSPGSTFFVTGPNNNLATSVPALIGLVALATVATPLEARLFMPFLMAMMLSGAFWVIPGMQFELVELGHRMKLRRSHVPIAAAIGILGGLVVGGWVYLNGAYATGADNFPIVGNFGSISARFSTLNTVLNSETLPERDVAGFFEGGQGLALGYGALMTGVIFVLRMTFAAFWFHPMGFIFGASGMMQTAWSSLLLAWALRFLVLRLGGAAAVRNKLTPFAIGCLAGIGAIVIVYAFILGYHHFFAPYDTKFDGTF